MTTPLRFGLLLFPRLTQLDMTGPFEVFSRVPGGQVHLVWKTKEPVRADTGLTMLPDTDFATCPPLDILCVPGGPGVAALMEDEEVLAFLRAQAKGARFVTSVCTGALVLGAAGLLKGVRATTHWASHDFLAALGAEPVHARWVRDGRVVTGGGVTAGIDFALALVADLLSPEAAQAIQLQIEYAPAPPFEAGSPETAPAQVLATAKARGAGMRADREALVARVAARLG
ncbi:DJ-1/PfpI family protein [Neoroseomonas oryzicola]|uniref:DJ-1/PfpI family protein n=1 Tax=Neoroseomonas oryzicola TaxID=535904 RepID=A0A9X9WPW2_9PROT|nr:DJ-1/PfpI family protein [Neoroseomonas oryzicola]MBR0662372.1 DJ-1/PfpI family protein [Neoroseomonas oryzicola]NKE16121.1 DJ-1/PfpI family protein [Neoroseomonas oryzicola]